MHVCCDIVWAIPVVARSPHACILSLVVVGLLSVGHAHTIYMLGLTLIDHGAHGLRCAVWAHRGMLLAWATIVPEIYVVDSTFPHLIFRRHRHLAFHVPCILRIGHVLHLLVPEMATFVVVHCNKMKS